MNFGHTSPSGCLYTNAVCFVSWQARGEAWRLRSARFRVQDLRQHRYQHTLQLSCKKDLWIGTRSRPRTPRQKASCDTLRHLLLHHHLLLLDLHTHRIRSLLWHHMKFLPWMLRHASRRFSRNRIWLFSGGWSWQICWLGSSRRIIILCITDMDRCALQRHDQRRKKVLQFEMWYICVLFVCEW